MRNPRADRWERVRVYFGVLVLALVALGVGSIYASSLADARRSRSLMWLRTIGLELIGLAVVSVVLAGWLKRRLSVDD
jgi:cell division protein FtsW (lipid II flippase)